MAKLNGKNNIPKQKDSGNWVERELAPDEINRVLAETFGAQVEKRHRRPFVVGGILLALSLLCLAISYLVKDQIWELYINSASGVLIWTACIVSLRPLDPGRKHVPYLTIGLAANIIASVIHIGLWAQGTGANLYDFMFFLVIVQLLILFRFLLIIYKVLADAVFNNPWF